jgi:magnesium-transporting ATPase (P-type)
MITIAAYLWALRVYGEGTHARTVAMLSIVAVQLGHLYNCRSRTRSAFKGFFKNPSVFVASAIVIILQVFAIYSEPVSRILELDVPNRADWFVVLVCMILPVIVVETAKAFMRKESTKASLATA